MALFYCGQGLGELQICIRSPKTFWEGKDKESPAPPAHLCSSLFAVRGRGPGGAFTGS